MLLSAPGQWRRIVLAGVAANLVFDLGVHGRSLTIALGFALMLHDYGRRRLTAWRKIELSALFAALFGVTLGDHRGAHA